MNRRRVSMAWLSIPIGLLCACGAAPDEGAADTGSSVEVTTMPALRRDFHDSVEAWGSIAGDPQRARAISLAHGGQVMAVQVAVGQKVRRGQALLVLAPDAATRNAWQQARNAWVLARDELGRTQRLAAQRLATQAQLAAARAALADAEAARNAQQAVGGGSAEEIVRAPADGTVTTLGVGLGDRVAANAPLLDFAPDRAWVARLGVSPDDGAALRPGMAVRMQTVYGAASRFSGRLLVVGQSIDPGTHLLPAQASIPAAAGSVAIAGAPLQASIRTADYSAWAVPRAAVLHDDRGDYLFQVEHGKARRVDVTVRHPQGDPVGVDGPLDAQAPVIALGAYELGDGDAVRMRTAETVR